MSKVVEITGDRVRSAIIPLDGMEMLLPNALVAEVIDYHDPKKIPKAPEWYLGKFQWRGKTLPLISFERIVGTVPQNAGGRMRIVVIYGLGKRRRETPYYGVVARDLPRLSRVGVSNIQADNSGVAHKVVAASVLVDGEKAAIPDVDALGDIISAVV